MKKLIIFLSAAFIFISQNSFSQNNSLKKYPSLLWEITGNGLKKPSYLFGTMHVSSKMVFHLPDSFYNAIKRVETVALELNPDVWQGQMVKLDKLQLNYKNFTQPANSDYINEKSFQLENYEDELKAALSSEPTVVNSLLYRSFKSKEDFEEDTFLDLYIFQLAKKLGKITTGVENYFETEKIVLQAYADMAKEKKKNHTDTDGESMSELQQKTEDAYRTGNLDLLDSLNNLIEESDAFRNKFLYRRNEIQANSIDTILRKNSLFVGVGAAHLAGDKGVIELLRKKGYILRPVIMAVKSSLQKDTLDKLKAPVKFIKNVAEDGLYKVDVPGTLYNMVNDNSPLNRSQYSDMSNGTYYLITRIKTYASFTNSNKNEVLNKVDSLLYENVPGKIIKKTMIKKSDYPGFDITNKTRRGDLQRYQIFITPFEVLIFKMSGKENYIQGAEAERFFSSIQLKEQATGWLNFEPKFGGFSVKFPQPPDEFLNTSSSDGIDRREYEAIDKSTGDAFLILKKTINNFRFLEEDTFDLSLIEESFKLSKFIAKQQQRSISSLNGYPCMDVQETLQDGGILKAKFIIKGADYYLLAAKSKNTKEDFNDFFSSFTFTPYKYQLGKNLVDTFLHYRVVTPVVPEIDESFRALTDAFGDESTYHFGGTIIESYWPRAKNEIFKSDSTGEMIAVAVQQYPKYYYVKDSAAFWKNEVNDYIKRTGFLLAKKAFINAGNDIVACKLILRDTNSSRQITRLVLLKNDRLYRLVSMGDTLGKESNFVKNFYATFHPDTFDSSRNIFANTIDNFLKDFYSTDSTIQAKAEAAISNIYYNKNDIQKIISVIKNLKFSEKNYFDIKSKFIAELGYINDPSAEHEVVNALKNIYAECADTGIFQNAVIRALAKNKTKQSYALLKELLMQDPPVFETDYEYISLFNDLNDSLLLAKQLFPEILQLSTINNFKDNINSLLVMLVDSNLIKLGEYENYYTKIYFDSRIELKKQIAKDEKKLAQEKSKDDNDEQKNFNINNFSNSKTSINNYAILLMPFYEQKAQVKSFFEKLLYSKDKAVQLSTAILMLRNNKYVPDSILFNLAADDQYRTKLYKNLDAAGIINKFPSHFKNQVDIARSVLVTNKNYSKIDSIVYLSSRPITFRNKNGIVYFFKYRVNKYDEWKIGISGLQPEKINDVSTNNRLTKMTDKKLIADEPINDQLKNQLKRLLFSLSKSGRRFYESESYSRFRADESVN